MIKKGGLLFFLVLLTGVLNAQEQPTYTQYLFNQQIFNPAYTGTWDKLGFTFINRSQWVKFPRYPQTNDFSVQSPIVNLNSAIGLDVSNNRIGLENRTGVYADYSYKLKLNDKGLSLRMGLKGGISIYNNDLTDYRLVDPNDPAYENNIGNNIQPNFGVGLFLWDEKFFVGFSAPKILNQKLKNNLDYKLLPSSRVYYLTGGYVFSLSEKWKFKPCVFFQMEKNSPFQADISANFLYNDFLWLGAMYRFGDAFGAILQVVIKKDFRIGYAYDLTVSNMSSHQDGVHEILLTVEFNTMKVHYQSPRHF